MCTGAAAASSSAPYFTEEPRSSVVRRGDSVSLRCAASSTASAGRTASESTDDVTVTWTHNGRTLDNPSSSSSSSSRVDIRSFRRSDEGLYQCIANSSLGALISRPATLRLARTLIYVCLHSLCNMQIKRRNYYIIMPALELRDRRQKSLISNHF